MLFLPEEIMQIKEYMIYDGIGKKRVNLLSLSLSLSLQLILGNLTSHRDTQGRGRRAWAYGKGWPWTP
jgi:hypothetical protein